MNKPNKALIAIICVATIAFMTSCSQKSRTGCPSWSKVKAEQTNKKSV